VFCDNSESITFVSIRYGNLKRLTRKPKISRSVGYLYSRIFIVIAAWLVLTVDDNIDF